MYGIEGQVMLRLRFSPSPGDEPGYGFSSTVPLDWAAETVHAFDRLLSHCVAVSYSDEQDLDELVMPDREAMPRVSVSSGSLVLELVTAQPTLWGANALGLLALLIKQGPELAGLPHRMRERWYSDAAAAEKARQSLEVLKAGRPAQELARTDQTEPGLVGGRSSLDSPSTEAPWDRLGEG